jgi:GntR family transcriptional regulator
LIAREQIRAPKWIAKALAIDPGALVIHLTRLRNTESQVISLNEVYVSQELCPWLLEEDLENQSLYQLYERHGLMLEWGKQIIEPSAATAEQARLLEVDPGSPLLYLERITYASSDLPVEWVQAYSPLGRYSLEMLLRR